MTAPHPTLTGHYARAEERQAFVEALFDRSAPHYDRINAWFSLGLGQFYRRRALERIGLRRGMSVLDVATGTGLVAMAARDLVGPHGSVVGLDPSGGMLRQAPRHGPIVLVQGLGEQLPLVANRFDLVTMGYALRHVPDMEEAFLEFFRVLKPGGRLLLLELAWPREGGVPTWLTRVLLGSVAPRLARLGTGSADAERLLRYFWSTIVECVPPATIVRALETAGFAPVVQRRYGRVLAEYEAVRPTATSCSAAPSPPGSPSRGAEPSRCVERASPENRKTA